jgi:hypothetical protein
MSSAATSNCPQNCPRQPRQVHQCNHGNAAQTELILFVSHCPMWLYCSINLCYLYRFYGKFHRWFFRTTHQCKHCLRYKNQHWMSSAATANSPQNCLMQPRQVHQCCQPWQGGTNGTNPICVALLNVALLQYKPWLPLSVLQEVS